MFGTLISSGRRNAVEKEHDFPTPTGVFRIREKHLTTTMDGDVASDGWISANMKGLLPIEVEKLAYRFLDRQSDQEVIDALNAAQAAEEKKALEESNKKAAALLKETEKEAKEIEAAVTAAFAVEAQAVEAAREAAKSAKAAADAAAAAAAKKKR